MLHGRYPEPDGRACRVHTQSFSDALAAPRVVIFFWYNRLDCGSSSFTSNTKCMYATTLATSVNLHDGPRTGST